MSQSSKQPMSGLRSIRRDFSSNTIPSSSHGTESNQPRKVVGAKSLHGQEMRLKLIQEALSGHSPSSETIASSSSSVKAGGKAGGHKRPSEGGHEDFASKRRQLPSSWNSAGTAPATQASSKYFTTAKALSSSAPVKQTLPSSASVNKTTPATTTSHSTSSSKKAAAVFLSQEQTHILKLVENGESIFYTGSAGTGKSVLLREIIRVLRKKYSKADDAVAVTASTGIAACNIGGVTIHSFAGIGIGVDEAEQLATRIRKNKKAMSRWLRTKVLIIDEVSMVDGDLFDKLSRVGCILRRNVQPFGGIQVIVTGDFFQLPPVSKGSQSVKFAFEAEYWKQTIKKTFNLTKVFRQSDPQFVDMLNEMRFGTLTPTSIAKFKALSRPIEYQDGVSATELYPRREDVERSNSNRMRNIHSETRLYTASEGGALAGTDQGAKMLANFMAPAKLELKVGAQVMLIKNIDEMLVNGSMGTIVEFIEPSKYLTNPDDPYTTNPTKPPSKAAGKDAKSSGSAAMEQKWPLVEFLTPRRRVLVTPESFKTELPNGEVQVSRTQLPLILAWAMSIHKSQGQTLERVKVDLARIFEKGQAYVALSRATSLEGLQVLNFDPIKVKAHPKVVEWTKTLEVIEAM